MSLSIVPECYADTRLAEILMQSKRCNHQKNLGQVANTLKNKLKDLPALGIVDDDKGSIPRYFSEFDLLLQTQDLKLLKHHNRNQYLIIICPAIKQCLLNTAKEEAVNQLDFGIKEGLKEFTNLTKSIHLGQSREFTDFVKALVKTEAPSIILLKKWLVDFKDGKSIH